MKEKSRNQKKERRVRKRLYEKYGDLINCKTEDIPEKHRGKKGGLRCFKKVLPRDEHGNKVKDAKKKRCGNNCANGSLYCRHHGGANSKALTTGNRTSMDMYRDAHSVTMQDYFTAFLNDPSIMDHKQELATLRTMLMAYIEKYSNTKPVRSPKKLMRMINQTAEMEGLDDFEKFNMIADIVRSEKTLLDGDVMDRISRLVTNIGNSIDRIIRNEKKDGYWMTPEGLKIMLRAFMDAINENVEGKDVKDKIRKALMQANTKAHGDIAVKAQVINVTQEEKS